MKEEEAERVKEYLEKGRGAESGHGGLGALPLRFFETFVSQGLRLHLIEPGRIVCSLRVPPRLLNAGGSMHGGATATLVDVVGSGVICSAGASFTGVSVDINVSYFDAPSVDEDIEIEARTLLLGQNIAVVSVELRKKDGKIIAQGRHTKYLRIRAPSKI